MTSICYIAIIGHPIITKTSSDLNIKEIRIIFTFIPDSCDVFLIMRGFLTDDILFVSYNCFLLYCFLFIVLNVDVVLKHVLFH